MDALALVLLAAGESRRLGVCKALVPLGADERSSPLALLLMAGAPVASSRALVVTGVHDGPIRRALAELARAGVPEAEVARNERWAEGRAGGLRLAATRRAGRDLLLVPVDVPLVAARTFRALAAAWEAAGRPARGWLAPRATAPGEAVARHGHPVIVGRELAAELRTWPDERSLRVLREAAEPLLAVDVDDPAVLDDLDAPEDLARLRRRLAGGPAPPREGSSAERDA